MPVVSLAGARVAIEVTDGLAHLDGLPRDLEAVADPRRPLQA